MEENKTQNLELENIQEEDEKSFFDLQAILMTLVLNWKWFVLSVLLCLGLAFLYLRYATPIYQATAKLLIKDENNSSRARSSIDMTNLGMITNNYGIDNEMEILASRSLATQAVRDLKLYVTYKSEGNVVDKLMYKNQPVSVDVDRIHVERLTTPIQLRIEKEKAGYHVTGSYYVPLANGGQRGPYMIDKTFNTLPNTIGTGAGVIYFTANTSKPMANGDAELVTVQSPTTAAYKYAGGLSVSQSSKTTSIARLIFTDEIPQRAADYLKQLAVVYNRQANEDKNQVAIRTEEFINSRLEKINNELGSTEGAIESYKKQNRMVELRINAQQAVGNTNEFEQRLADASTQIQLLNSLSQEVDNPVNKYQLLPANIGIQDGAATSLINKYNEIVMERNRLLRSAAENSPTVTPLTAQLESLSSSIRQALNQARRGLEIRRSSIASQVGKYSSQIAQTPEQERILTQIGRQQEVKSGLYLMLLQKREENSISLAATADKGKLIDNPQMLGQISPKRQIILLIALIVGLLIPALILFLVKFLNYRIEGHDDVARLTRLPIIADVPVASETAKTKADIVVHENTNNQMEEVFRSMRTNVNFMLKEHQKVIMFTSSTSGEGKTFNAANLAVSYALLGKRVVLLGLDIRKPRLAELFEIDDHNHGITPLLALDEPTWADVNSQILSSGVHANLDLLLAGPIPPNPSELVERPSLDKVIELLKEKYDYVLIDTAPVGLVTDTLQIGRIADATIFMCRADYTPKSNFGLINNLGQSQKLPNIAIVINGIDMSKKKYGYYYGYGKYGRYAQYGYGRYGKYGYGYGRYGYGSVYGGYGYGNYRKSNYGNKNDDSIKLK
ncbi:MAG: polysaccharide biosynthesis tyrosine autokinase [Prevotella sp.]|nr:polysaccharide biosynthesis tyrosine autokinase [Prevotella sp.]